MRAHPSTPASRGFSLAEIMVAIVVIGILASVAIPIYSKCYESSRAVLAGNMMETLNSAVHRFNQGNYEIIMPADDTSTAEEMAILRTLQFRDPTNPLPGTPYMRCDWNPLTSSNSNDYRIAWTGKLYKLLSPGMTGSGLKVLFDGSDLGTPYHFPPDYTQPGK